MNSHPQPDATPRAGCSGGDASRHAPVHPGEILDEEFLQPIGPSAGNLARALGVPRSRIERIVRREVPVTTDTALRLSRYWGNSAEFWLGLQTRFDLGTDRSRIASDLAAIRPREAA
jgi:addiction module HigA family antidote